MEMLSSRISLSTFHTRTKESMEPVTRRRGSCGDLAQSRGVGARRGGQIGAPSGNAPAHGADSAHVARDEAKERAVLDVEHVDG